MTKKNRKSHRRVQIVGNGRMGFFILLGMIALFFGAVAWLSTATQAEEKPAKTQDLLGAAVAVIGETVGSSQDPTDKAVLSALQTLGRETQIKQTEGEGMMVLMEKDGSFSLIIPSNQHMAALRPEVLSFLLYHEMVHLSLEYSGKVDHTSYDSWLEGEHTANEGQMVYTRKLLSAGYKLSSYASQEEAVLMGKPYGFLEHDLPLYEKDKSAWKEMITARYAAAADQLQDSGRDLQDE